MANLRIPGPTPIPPEVQEAMSRQMFNHRGPQFASTMARVTEKLQHFFQTTNDLYLLSASGTGALEAGVVNFFSPGDHLLAVSIGYFGDRIAKIAETYGAHVKRIEFEWGTPADPAAVRQALSEDPEIKGVLVTHNETSTGVTNNLEAISREVRNADKLLVVDGVSSAGSIPLLTDEWGCDVVLSGSQKGWMVPPGMAMISISPRAWEAHKTATMPRFYFDVTAAKDYFLRGQTPFTPTISIVVALDVALEMLAREGRDAVFERHHRVAEQVRQGVEKLGLSLYADANHRSDTVTAVTAPEGVEVPELLRVLREDRDVVLATGQGPLTGKIFRIGHLGWVQEGAVTELLQAIGGHATAGWLFASRG